MECYRLPRDDFGAYLVGVWKRNLVRRRDKCVGFLLWGDDCIIWLPCRDRPGSVLVHIGQEWRRFGGSFAHHANTNVIVSIEDVTPSSDEPGERHLKWSFGTSPKRADLRTAYVMKVRYPVAVVTVCCATQ